MMGLILIILPIGLIVLLISMMLLFYFLKRKQQGSGVKDFLEQKYILMQYVDYDEVDLAKVRSSVRLGGGLIYTKKEYEDFREQVINEMFPEES